jgi:putative NADH-flavin reductase
MLIGIFGASGTIGQRIVAEALRRGHKVRAFARDVARIPRDPVTVTWDVANILDVDSIVRVIEGLDVLINAFGPGPNSNSANEYTKEAVDQAIRAAGFLVTAAHALLKALEKRPELRLIIVGGGGSLEIQPGLQGVDTGAGLAAALAELGLPPSYDAVVRYHREALNVYRVSDRNWTYLSPALVTVPGERTGRFRLGGNQILVDADGRSRISSEDYAVALMDEVEIPLHIQRRFTVGY